MQKNASRICLKSENAAGVSLPFLAINLVKNEFGVFFERVPRTGFLTAVTDKVPCDTSIHTTSSISPITPCFCIFYILNNSTFHYNYAHYSFN